MLDNLPWLEVYRDALRHKLVPWDHMIFTSSNQDQDQTNNYTNNYKTRGNRKPISQWGFYYFTVLEILVLGLSKTYSGLMLQLMKETINEKQNIKAQTS